MEVSERYAGSPGASTAPAVFGSGSAANEAAIASPRSRQMAVELALSKGYVGSLVGIERFMSTSVGVGRLEQPQRAPGGDDTVDAASEDRKSVV